VPELEAERGWGRAAPKPSPGGWVQEGRFTGCREPSSVFAVHPKSLERQILARA